MSEKKDGGPAFPRQGEGCFRPEYHVSGMSLRDWFAGQALNGMLVDPGRMEIPRRSDEEGLRQLAGWAYRFADAMIAKR